MPRRGTFTVISEDESAELKALASNTGDVDALAEKLEDKYFESDRQCEVDAVWAWMHRCFEPNSLVLTSDASNPFNLIVLGGQDILQKSDAWSAYQLVILKTAQQVSLAAKACTTVDRENLRARYDSIDPAAYEGTKCDDDFEGVWSYFELVTSFYDRASNLNEPVLFTATG